MDIREYFQRDYQLELQPTRKGICLTPEVWQVLLSRAEEVNAAINELKGLGSPVKQLIEGVDKAEKEALNEVPRDSTDDEN